MSKEIFTDGVCDNCGNVGLAGEKCVVCGDIMKKINAGTDDPVLHADSDLPPNKGEPEVYPLEVLEEEEQKNPAVTEE